jgi:DNA polymerase-3 subunit chi
VLVNLKASLPAGFEAFARVIEVVTLEESDRQQARERWRQYRAQGIEPQRHDLVSTPQS